MKRAFLPVTLIILLITVALLLGCNRAGSVFNGSGRIIDHEVKTANFNSLNIKGPFIVEVKQAETCKVTLSTDDNLLKRIRISLERRTLKFNIEAPATFFPTYLKIAIAMPQISSLNLSDGARAVISGFKSTDDFILFMSKGSALDGYLEAGTVQFHLSGGSQVSLNGKALRLELEAKGVSKLDLADFTLTSAMIELEEASEATLNVNGRFDAVLSDKSRVYYLGNPLFSDTSISGGATMLHK